MSRQCDFPIEDLIDYADGLLVGERRATVEAHLRTCDACQRRALSADDMGRLFREHVVESGPGFEMDEQQRPHVAMSHHPRAVPWRMALAAAAILMVLVVALEPATSLADFRLGRLVAFIIPDDDGSPANVPGDQEPPGTPMTSLEQSSFSIESLPFQVVMPQRLPLDLVLVEHSASTDGTLTILYRNQSGLTIDLIQGPADPSGASVDVDAVEWIVVREIEVLLQRDSRLSASVYRAVWESEDVLFDLWVAKSLSAGLSVAEMTAVVEAIMIEQSTTE
ncbi:hypothetical protein BH24CHL1_BH24CHL1_15840 [soil metagenome]